MCLELRYHMYIISGKISTSRNIYIFYFTVTSDKEFRTLVQNIVMGDDSVWKGILEIKQKQVLVQEWKRYRSKIQNIHGINILYAATQLEKI